MPADISSLSGLNRAMVEAFDSNEKAEKAMNTYKEDKLPTWAKVLIGIFTVGIGAAVIAGLEHSRESEYKSLKTDLVDIKDSLYAKLNSNEDKSSFEINITFCGNEAKIVKHANSETLKIQISGEEYELGQTLTRLVQKLEDEITSNTQFFGRKAAFDVILSNGAQERADSERIKEINLSPEKTLDDNDNELLAKDIDQNKLDKSTTSNRTRELMNKFIQSSVGVNAGETSNLSFRQLYSIAKNIYEGHLADGNSVKESFKDVISTHLVNSLEAAEILKNFEEAKVSEDTILNKIDTSVLSKTEDSKEVQPSETDIKKAEVQKFVADLIYSDSSSEDNIETTPGERIHRILENNVPLLKDIFANLSLLDNLPDEMKSAFTKTVIGFKMMISTGKSLSEITNDLKNMSIIELGVQAVKLGFKSVSEKEIEDLLGRISAQDYAKIANEFDSNIEEAASTIQDKMTRLIDDVLGKSDDESDEDESDAFDNFEVENRQAINQMNERDKLEYYAKGREILNGMLEKTVFDFSKPGYGMFMKDVLTTYFKDLDIQSKRAIIAAGIRYSTGKSSDGVKFGAMLKGCGPLLQKMLQAFNSSDIKIDPDVRKAIEDMKNNLAPISKNYIDAQLMDIVKRSNGAIEKITVNKSLGAASVGQALMCTIKMAGSGEEKSCVIKIIRPDVAAKIQRELKVFNQAAEKESNPGMKITFKGQLDRILEELDLNLEAENVREGKLYDKPYTDVKAMKLSSVVPSTSTVMVMEKAPGTTLSDFIKDTKKQISELLKDCTVSVYKDINYAGNDGGMHEFVSVKNNKEIIDLQNKIKDLFDKTVAYQKKLANFCRSWVTEGIYKSGFYHGDLHAGNFMVSDEQLTAIDFGNVTKLSREEQKQVMIMMSSTCCSDINNFITSFSSLMTPQGRTYLNENMTPELRAELEKILNLGSPADSGKRIALALKVLEQAGFEIPAAIYNFSQSQQRLQSSLDATNNLVKRLSELYSYISTESYDLKGIDFKNLYDLARIVHSGDNLSPLSHKSDVEHSLSNVFNNKSRATFNEVINTPDKLIELCKHLVANYAQTDKNSIFNDEETNKAPIAALKEFVEKFEKGKRYADQLKAFNIDGTNYFNDGHDPQAQKIIRKHDNSLAFYYMNEGSDMNMAKDTVWELIQHAVGNCLNGNVGLELIGMTHDTDTNAYSLKEADVDEFSNIMGEIMKSNLQATIKALDLKTLNSLKDMV
ncbi:MAG: AarF/UbiB family protein [Succinivibrio sp.]